MEKKKNSKIKEYWNEKGKSLCFKILHIVCYVLSLGFIILCVYACANTNNKDNKQENVKKVLYKENPLQLVSYNQNDVSVLIENEDDLQFYFSSLEISLQDYANNHLEYDYTHMRLWSAERFDLKLSFNGYNSVNTNVDSSDPSYISIDYRVGSDSHLYLDISIEYVDYSPSGYIHHFGFDYSDIGDSYPLVIKSTNVTSSNIYGNIINPSTNLFSVYQDYIEYDADNFFLGVTDSMTDYIDTIGKGLESSVEIFYDEDNSQLTAIGWLSVIVVAVGLTWSVFSIISGLIRLRG